MFYVTNPFSVSTVGVSGPGVMFMWRVQSRAAATVSHVEVADIRQEPVALPVLPAAALATMTIRCLRTTLRMAAAPRRQTTPAVPSPRSLRTTAARRSLPTTAAVHVPTRSRRTTAAVHVPALKSAVLTTKSRATAPAPRPRAAVLTPRSRMAATRTRGAKAAVQHHRPRVQTRTFLSTASQAHRTTRRCPRRPRPASPTNTATPPARQPLASARTRTARCAAAVSQP